MHVSAIHSYLMIGFMLNCKSLIVQEPEPHPMVYGESLWIPSSPGVASHHFAVCILMKSARSVRSKAPRSYKVLTHCD